LKHLLLSVREAVQWEKVVVVLLFIPIILNNVLRRSFPQWVELARGFLSGKLGFAGTPTSVYDTALYGGSYFWPFGPLPAVILMPFVAIADFFQRSFMSGYLQPVFGLGVYYTIVLLSKRLGYSSRDSRVWALAFLAASPFLLCVINPNWGYFAHPLAALLMFAALYEYLNKKSYIRIGSLMGLLALTRPTAALSIIFFLFDIATDPKKSAADKRTQAIRLLSPFIIAVCLLSIYNVARFDNFFEHGYNYQQVTELAVSTAREYGLFSPIHIPGNIYYFLFAAPLPVFLDGVSHVLAFPYITPDPWGMGIFFSSPYLLLLFFLPLYDRISKLLLVTALIIAVPIFLYYGIGYFQIGYRYALDFFPLLLYLLMKNYKAVHPALSSRLKLLIMLAVLFNVYLVIVK